MGQIAGHNPADSHSDAEIARTLAETAARRRTVVIAGHSGDLETALAALTDDAAPVRASALLALQRMGRLSRSALRSALADPEPRVRRTAAQVAATWVDPGEPVDPDQPVETGQPTKTGQPTNPGQPVDLDQPGVPHSHDVDDGLDLDLVRLLRDPDPEVVEVAAWACGERVPTDDRDDEPFEEPDVDRPGRLAVVDALVALATSHDDALVREAAVAALGAIGDDRGLAAILHATTDKATVRRRAVIALAPFEGPEVDAALRNALDDRDWQVRQAAEDLLA